MTIWNDYNIEKLLTYFNPATCHLNRVVFSPHFFITISVFCYDVYVFSSQFVLCRLLLSANYLLDLLIDTLYLDNNNYKWIICMAPFFEKSPQGLTTILIVQILLARH